MTDIINIPNYTLISKIGEGGMGAVWLAMHNLTQRKVAIKVLKQSIAMMEEDSKKRFMSEASTLSQLHHTAITMLYDAGTIDDNMYMVMEYAEGETLESRLKRLGRLPVEEVLNIAIKTLDGLQHAHSKNIIHRDLKPANIMLSPDGNVKIMDFGIARMLGNERLTMTNFAIGTPQYMSPEQFQGSEGSFASDIYSLGIVMYELLIGRVPFDSKNFMEIMNAHCDRRPTAPQILNEEIPALLNSAILKALNKDPAKRFSSAEDFRKCLVKIYDEGKTKKKKKPIDDDDEEQSRGFYVWLLTTLAPGSTSPIVPVTVIGVALLLLGGALYYFFSDTAIPGSSPEQIETVVTEPANRPIDIDLDAIRRQRAEMTENSNREANTGGARDLSRLNSSNSGTASSNAENPRLLGSATDYTQREQRSTTTAKTNETTETRGRDISAVPVKENTAKTTSTKPKEEPKTTTNSAATNRQTAQTASKTASAPKNTVATTPSGASESKTTAQTPKSNETAYNGSQPYVSERWTEARDTEKEKVEEKQELPVPKETEIKTATAAVTTPSTNTSESAKTSLNKNITINRGTSLSVVLTGSYSFDSAVDGTRIVLSVADNVQKSGETVIRKGARAYGVIRKNTQRKVLRLEMTDVECVTGQRLRFMQKEIMKESFNSGDRFSIPLDYNQIKK